jgi:hypothetical protein
MFALLASAEVYYFAAITAAFRLKNKRYRTLELKLYKDKYVPAKGSGRTGKSDIRA